MKEIKEILDEFFNYDGEINMGDAVHGKVIDFRFDAYHDVTVYEDGYEEKYYIGD